MGKVTFGARGDSFYEYLLKLWLLSDKAESDKKYRQAYDNAIEGLHEQLLHQSKPSGMYYLSQLMPERLDNMEELACFSGGLLALGAYTDPNGFQSARAQRDLATAKALTYTCYQMFERTVTGLAGENVLFRDGVDFFYKDDDSRFALRPETVESLFILHEITGDPMYRDWGWDIFTAIERFCKTEYGYTQLHGVQNSNPYKEDKAESFFMAEVLKYFYLLFGGGEPDMLKKYVFTTESHILSISSST